MKNNAVKEFIAWDGEETQDAGYCLFGNSKGVFLRSPNLDTADMLECMVDTADLYPNAFHVAFAFDYDVNQILKDVPWPMLATLRQQGHMKWQGYEIEHIPHKIFLVKKIGANGKVLRSIRIDDIFSYFRSRYDKVLHKYKISTVEIRDKITEGKEMRSDFHWKDIDFIQSYWELELTTMVELMDTIRGDINEAGFFIGQWHGPGALAAYALREKGSVGHKKVTPDEVQTPVRIAYSGGWFERFKAGYHPASVYTADINSAYAYAFSMLPSLSKGEWHHVEKPHPDLVDRFGVFHIKFSNPKLWAPTMYGLPLPLFLRGEKGDISHPCEGDGWYWSPEAKLAVKYLMNQGLDCEITEAWLFNDDGTYPFSWVADMYEERLAMQAVGNPAEKALKYTMASLYGRVAQRAGWRRTKSAPAWHQLEWAGFITSTCRAMIFEAAWPIAKQGGLVSIDTDGITSTVPFGEMRNGVSDKLGAWKLEEFSSMIYIQNGIYWMKDQNGEWLPPKLRGIPRAKMDPEVAMNALRTDGKIKLDVHNFIGYGAALQGRRSEWRTWKTVPNGQVIDVANSGTRAHVPEFCRSCYAGKGLHECLHDMSLLHTKSYVSEPHELPWIDYDPKADYDWMRKIIAGEW